MWSWLLVLAAIIGWSSGLLVREFGEVEEEFVAVEAAAVAVAEIEADGVVADAFPVEHAHTGKLTLIGAAVALAEDVFFAALFGAGRGGAELFHLEKGFGAVAPGDGDFAADELDVGGCFQSRKGVWPWSLSACVRWFW